MTKPLMPLLVSLLELILTIQSTSEPKTKPCRECAERIPLDAKICGECKSYQDWRRFLPFSTTVLALLTALIAVIGATAPQLKKLIEKQDSDLSVLFIGDDRTGGLRLFLRTLETDLAESGQFTSH